MFHNNRKILWLWPACLVLISCVCAYPRGYGDQQVNLKIGFDLTQEVNGEPALRIRDFQDSAENYPRAVDSADGDKVSKHIRADSFSASDEESNVKETPVKEKKSKREREQNSSREASKPSREEESDSDERKVRSTQGIRAGDYDPDDTGKIHGRDADDSDGNAR